MPRVPPRIRELRTRGKPLWGGTYCRAVGISAVGGVAMGAIVVSVSDGICGSGPSSATASTWSMLSTKCNFISLRRFSGTSATSFSFSCGRITSNNTGAMRGQQLLLQSADRQHLAAQRDLAGHGDIAAHRNPAQRAGQSGCDGDAGRRAVFRNRAFGHVHVNVKVAVEIARQSEPRRPRANVRHGSLRRLLHHIAELAG